MVVQVTETPLSSPLLHDQIAGQQDPQPHAAIAPPPHQWALALLGSM